MKRIAVAFGVFVLVYLVLTAVLPLGMIGALLAIIPAWVVYSKMGSGAASGGEIVAAGGIAGAPTFSWKGVDVYQDQGYFTYHGRRYEIANVSRISYETSGVRGCMGGTHYKVHIHMRDLKMPRVTVGAGNITTGGNDETERNYERLGIVLGCS